MLEKWEKTSKGDRITREVKGKSKGYAVLKAR
jgi:hypothetical protein